MITDQKRFIVDYNNYLAAKVVLIYKLTGILPPEAYTKKVRIAKGKTSLHNVHV